MSAWEPTEGQKQKEHVFQTEPLDFDEGPTPYIPPEPWSIQETQDSVDYIPHYPHHQQATFLVGLTDHRFKIHVLVGGAGAGKTQAAVQACVDRGHRVPGERIAFVRKYAKDHKGTTWGEVLTSLPPELIAPNGIKIQDKEIYLLSCNPEKPTKVEFQGMDERNRWGGRAYSVIIVDEANELDVKDFFYLFTRMRHNPPVEAMPPEYVEGNPYLLENGKVHRYIILLCNPPDRVDHWLRKLYTERALYGKSFPVKVTRTRTMDNVAALDQSYLDLLNCLPEQERLRMMEGEDTIGIHGRPCTPSFQTQKHVIYDPLPKEPFEGFDGWDLGYNHPYVSLWQDLGGVYILWAEVLEEDLTTWQLADHVMRARARFHPDTAWTKSYVDHNHAHQNRSSAKETDAQILRGLGFSIKSRFSHPRDRATLVDRLLQADRILIHHTCSAARSACVGGWHRDEDGEPEKDGYFDNIGDGLGIPLMVRCGPRANKGPLCLISSSHPEPTRKTGGRGTLKEELSAVSRPNYRGMATSDRQFRRIGAGR